MDGSDSRMLSTQLAHAVAEFNRKGKKSMLSTGTKFDMSASLQEKKRDTDAELARLKHERLKVDERARKSFVDNYFV